MPKVKIAEAEERIGKKLPEYFDAATRDLIPTQKMAEELGVTRGTVVIWLRQYGFAPVEKWSRRGRRRLS